MLTGSDCVTHLQKSVSVLAEFIYTEKLCVPEMLVDGKAVARCNCDLRHDINSLL